VTSALVKKPIIELLADLEGAGVATPTRLNLKGEISYKRCEALARYIGGLRDATAWWMGDLFAYAKATYDDDHAYQLAEAFGRSPDRVSDYCYVSERVAAPERHPALSWTHHRAVAKLDPDEQRLWLDKAEDELWTASDLREQIKGSTRSRTGKETVGTATVGEVRPVPSELEKAARAVVRAANPDGNGFMLVPVDTWARFLSVLGMED